MAMWDGVSRWRRCLIAMTATARAASTRLPNIRRHSGPSVVLGTLLLLSGLLPSGVGAQGASFLEGGYVVTRVVDGDTLWVRGLDRSIRFAGVNAPEVGQECGADATALVNQYARAGAAVAVEPAEFDFDPGTNRYRAYLRVDVNGEPWTLEELLLLNGLARMDRGGRYETTRYFDWFDQAERAAREQRKGIWGAGCSGGGGGDGRRADPIGWDCPEAYPIKGNANSMIYHLPGGGFYDRTRPEDCFATEADARAGGYRASRR